MEYIELDIKRIIYELLQGKIVPYSVELNCEILGTDFRKLYGTNVYVGEEKEGTVEVRADFNCKLQEERLNSSNIETTEKGSFIGLFNIDHKCFVDEGACEVRF